jgi:hypothetical protein
MGFLSRLFGAKPSLYKYELVAFADPDKSGYGLVVRRIEDGQKLEWRTLPKSEGLRAFNLSTKNYPKTLQDKAFVPGRAVQLRPEPTNEYDSNAIAVYDGSGKSQVGYLYREDAAALTKAMKKKRFVGMSMWVGSNEGQRTSLRVLVVEEKALELVKFPAIFAKPPLTPLL